MTRIILALLLSTTLVLGQSQVPRVIPNAEVEQSFVDMDFVFLIKWSTDIDVRAKEFNLVCLNDPTTDACQLRKQQMSQDINAFLNVARVYHRQGEGCAADVRFAFVQHMIALYSWNIQCAGKPHTPQCTADDEALKRKTAEVKALAEKCAATLRPTI